MSDLIAVRKAQDSIVVDLLRRHGVDVASVFDLVNSSKSYPRALPALVEALNRISDPWIKEGVVRALTVKEARGVASEPLLREFSRIPPDASPAAQGLRWAIANALTKVATTSDFEQLADLVRDRRHGTAREMLVVAVGRLKDKRIDAFLLECLDDDEIAAHAIYALGLRRSQAARPLIKKFRNHANPRIRQEAARALERMTMKRRER